MFVGMATGAAGPHPDDGSDPRFEESSYEFDPRDVRIRQDGAYDIVELPGSVPDVERSRLGQPQLPVVIKWFAIPKDSKVASVEVQAAEWTELPGRLLPPPIGWEDDYDQDRDSEYYASDRPFPPLHGFASRSTEYRGYHLAQVVVYPVRWDPLTGTAALARDLRVSVRIQPLSGDEARSVPRVRRPEGADPYGETRRFLLGMVENRSEMERLYPWTERGTRMEQEHRVVESAPYGAVPTTWPSTEGPTVERVIIYDNQTLSGEPIGNVGTHAVDYALFCLYHEGRLTAPVKLSDILAQYGAGADVPEILRQFALDCYELWRTSSILLVGDLDVIPARRFGGPTDDGGLSRVDPPSDVYITTFRKNANGSVTVADWNEDDNAWEWETNTDPGVLPRFDSQPGIAVGRLPARTADDAEAMFRKLMEYRQPERFGKVAPPDSYYRSGLFAAGLLNSGVWDSDNGMHESEDVIAAIEAHWPDGDLHRLYAPIPDDILSCDGTPFQCYKSVWDNLGPAWEAGDEDWYGTALFENLDAGPHFAFHAEHSDTDRWGTPSRVLPEDTPACPPNMRAKWQEACADLADYSGIQPLTLATVRSLTNGIITAEGEAQTPRYSIVASHGSWTNALDRATIAEELLATPNGGAVAYLGKYMSLTTYNDMIPTFFGFLADTSSSSPPNIGAAVAWAAATGLGQTYYGYVQRATMRPLLGDPGMEVFAEVPQPLEVVLPNAVGLGPQTFSVTVRGADSLDPVEGAIVTAQQDSVAWATAVTNANGVAVFEAFTVRRDSNIRINAAHRNFYSGDDTLDVAPAAPYLTYDHHVLDDDAPGGDGDGVLEAGETASLRVIWRNEGSATATAPVLSLRPSPSVEFHLQINGEYRPAEVYIGSKSATPPNTVTESFRLPVTWEGVSVHGEPNAVSLEENFKVWRKHDTGEYVVSARSPSAQTDSTFTGILRTDGSFSNVSMTGESGVDSYFASADSIWFQFHGDASADNLTFRAEAVDWVTVTANATGLVLGVAVGDTIGRNFDVELTGDVPDRTVLPFTATAKQNGTVYTHGELAFEVHAPALDLWVLDDVATTASGCGVARSFFPTLWNGGTAEADSVIVRARVVSGSATVNDSLAAYGRLDPDRAAVLADSIVVCAADSASLANSILDLDIQVLLRNEENQWYDPGEVGCGGGGPPETTDPGLFVAESSGRAIQLRWDPVASLYGEPVTRYLVYVRGDGAGDDSLALVGQVFGASRFEVSDIDGERLEPFDENGDPRTYEFALRACSRWRCGLPSGLSLPGQPNFTQHEGWPKTVPSGLTTAPLTVDLDGREAVFVAGREIYAWWLDDGTAVADPDSGKADGFFYDPGLPLEASTVFAEKLVELPLFDEGERTGTAIVGNVVGDAVYAVVLSGPDANGDFEPDTLSSWKKSIKTWNTAPMVLELNPIDLDSEYQVAIAGRTDTLYVWMDDGEPYLSNYTTNPGAYARFDADGSSHRTLAEWYYPFLLNEPVEHYIVQSMRNGSVVQWDTPPRGSQVLASTRWVAEIEAADTTRFVISGPSVGDVDGDGEAEVVVTDHAKRLGDRYGSPDCGQEPCGEVWILDGSDGTTECYAQDDDWLFESQGAREPATRPILANLEGWSLSGLEILIGSWKWVPEAGGYGTEYQVRQRPEFC